MRILHRVWIWGPVLAYLVLIFYVSSLSQVPWEPLTPDYVSHAAEYFGLALLLARALNDGLGRPVPPRRLLYAWALCVGYAISDEIHQKFVPDRCPAIADVLSDATGAGLALVLLGWPGWRWLRERR